MLFKDPDPDKSGPDSQHCLQYTIVIIFAARKPTTIQQVDCNSWTNCCTIRSDFLYTFYLIS